VRVRAPLMSAPTIGFYAHHHGRGHLSRVAAICRVLGPERCTVATSRPDAEDVLPPGTHVSPLPMDVPVDGDVGDVTAGGALHWAPEHPVVLDRTRALLEWLDARRPDVVLVDVSVEVALTVRLAGVPVVVTRQHGDRDDPAHQLGYRIAAALLAPYPAALEHPATPAHVLDRTVHAGFVGPEPDGRPWAPCPDRVVVAWGRGHPPPNAVQLDRAATATPDWDWHMVGPDPAGALRRVRHHGWVDEPGELLASAAVVVSPPGYGLVAEVAALGVPYVAVCEARPFREHHRKAEALEAVGGAVTVDGWPDADRWPALLERAAGMRPGALHLGGDGAAAAAALLVRVAGSGGGRG